MPLVIDLLRHGQAEPEHAEGDASRTLTAHGRRSAVTLGETLRAEHWTPTAAFVSPLKRAGETADLVLQSAGIAVEVIVLDELTPDRDPEDTARAALEHGGENGHLLLVGHQPLLSRLCRLLTGEDIAPAPCDLARIEFPDGERIGAGRLTRVIRAVRG